MRNITVVTGTRAEYGVLKNTMRAIDNDDFLNLQVIVTGTHLSDKHGYTINEIIEDGFSVDAKIPIILDYKGKNKNSIELGKAIEGFAVEFERLNTDILLILGDRYEILGAASAAMVMNIPIAHISGGEITEGAMDEQIRHSITKMAHLHFPGAKEYAENIRKMGEESWRIFNVGDPGIENIKLTKMLSKEELHNDLGVEVDEDTLLITYHPVTLEIDKVEEQINNLINALARINRKKIITYPNSDNGGEIIINKLNYYAKNNEDVFLFKNLGSLRYLSVMNLCGAVIGNSSSALIEAPYLKKAVVNIGNRQKGRLMAGNIITCSNSEKDIVNAINTALSSEFKENIKNIVSLYGEGNTSKEIVRILKEIEIDEKLLKKVLKWEV